VWLANLQDPDLLKQLLEFRKQSEKNGASAAPAPMTKEEMIARALESEKAIAKGEGKDWETLVNEKW